MKSSLVLKISQSINCIQFYISLSETGLPWTSVKPNGYLNQHIYFLWNAKCEL